MVNNQESDLWAVQSVQNDSEDSDEQLELCPVASAQQPPQEPLSYNQPPPEQMSIAAAVGRVDPRRALVGAAPLFYGIQNLKICSHVDSLSCLYPLF